MKAVKIIQLLMFILLISNTTWAQNPENWTSRQLIEPSQLAQVLQSAKDLPVIISVGPGATIPHSIDIGTVKDQENLDIFKKELNTVPKETKIVIYCGCCPFDHCPNVRPAIAVLRDMKFTSYQLLNLPNNIKADWIDKGYPVSKK
jgi:rhodanese-related sulfurtransferase